MKVIRADICAMCCSVISAAVDADTQNMVYVVYVVLLRVIHGALQLAQLCMCQSLKMVLHLLLLLLRTNC